MSRLSLTQICQNLVLESTTMSAHEIAKVVKKPYSTLMREVNPYDAGAKLGAETLLEIMCATGNIAPLEHMAKELGLKVIPA